MSSEKLHGIGVDSQFPDLGYELFLDRDTLRARFFAVDVLDPSAAQELTEVNAMIDIVWAASFFHLFPRPRQLLAAKAAVALLKPAPGSTLVGRQLGSA